MPIITDEHIYNPNVGLMKVDRTITRVPLLLAGVLATGAACVHGTFERTGRLRLDDGREGLASVFAVVPDGHEEVARITVTADYLGTSERLERHLLRRASLIGCAGVVDIEIQEHVQAEGTCVQRRELEPQAVQVVAVKEPPAELWAKARAAGPRGESLLAVLAQVQARPTTERAWPLQWYVQNYPQSPFAAEVERLMIRQPQPAAAPRAASVRMAPTSP